MTFVTKMDREALVLEIGGELDATSVAEIRETLDRMAAGKNSFVIVDLSGLRLIDSSGVGALVSLYKRLRNSGGTVILRSARDQPLAILQLLKLDRVLMTEESAAA